MLLFGRIHTATACTATERRELVISTPTSFPRGHGFNPLHEAGCRDWVSSWFPLVLKVNSVRGYIQKFPD